ncbi:hypothetical protein NDU88_002589 [Pleurodeles waltl]|uniref:Uncharacterized protein n=1 Tax=Pleurodeles waltl TaxID=8319 RepID=A0AAV7LE69_PLEWA|nr:hypothetical protein NDU88_002589 [Pleurodeles waltl]
MTQSAPWTARKKTDSDASEMKTVPPASPGALSDTPVRTRASANDRHHTSAAWYHLSPVLTMESTTWSTHIQLKKAAEKLERYMGHAWMFELSEHLVRTFHKTDATQVKSVLWSINYLTEIIPD